jgi:hypothetical protein
MPGGGKIENRQTAMGNPNTGIVSPHTKNIWPARHNRIGHPTQHGKRRFSATTSFYRQKTRKTTH